MSDRDRDMFPDTSLEPLYDELMDGSVETPHSVYSETTGRLEKLERWLAAFFGTLLSILFVILLCILCSHRVFGDPGPPLLIVGVLVVIAEIPFLYRLWSCARRAAPIGPAVAARTTPLQFPLRLIVIFCEIFAPLSSCTGYGISRGVQYVLNDASVQFRWSSISKMSPSKAIRA